MARRAHHLLAPRPAVASLPSRSSGARKAAETRVPAQGFLGNVWGVSVSELQIPVRPALQPRTGCCLVIRNLLSVSLGMPHKPDSVFTGEHDSSSAGCVRTNLASAAS